MQLNDNLIYFLAGIGILVSSYLLVALVKSLVHYAKFRELPISLQEKKLQLVEIENERLSLKIKQLEKETEQMTLAVLQQLNR
jgi:hypothetical protein